jgi:hypothetical protein
VSLVMFSKIPSLSTCNAQSVNTMHLFLFDRNYPIFGRSNLGILRQNPYMYAPIPLESNFD